MLAFAYGATAFDWESGVDGFVGVVVSAEGFSGPGVHQGTVDVGTPGDEPGHTSGPATITVQVRDRLDFGEAVDARLVLEGSFTGEFDGMLGSGRVEGDIGVCNVREP